MKIWRHFFFIFIKTVLAVLLLLVILYLIITFIENSLYYFKNRVVPSGIITQFYLWQVPDITLQILPFAVLIAGIIMHWSLARSGEISALHNAGMSWWRISFPFISGALFYVIVHFCLSEFVRPYALKKYYYVKDFLIEKNSNKNIFADTTWIRVPHGILHFKEYDAETKTLKNPEFFSYNIQNSSLQSIARSDDAYFDQKKNTWVFHDATITNFENVKKYGVARVQNFDTHVHFAPPKILKENVSSNELSYFELKKLVDSAHRADINVLGRLMDLYLKTSQPFSNLLFLLFTVPFAFQHEREQANYFNILICLASAIVYSLGNLAFKNLAVHGFLPPLIAAWGMNVIFGISILIVIAKFNKPA